MRRQLTAIPILFAAVITFFLLAILVAFGAAHSVSAGHSSSTINLIAIDAVPQDNTGTSLGERDFCIRTEVGSTVQVDITVDAIPDDRPILGFGVQLKYDPAIIEVIAADNAYILASSGEFTAFEGLSDPLPDSDGAFAAAIIDASSNQPLGANMESGTGVLSRITLKAIATGVSDLTLGSSIEQGGYPTLLDDQNEIIQVDNAGGAAVAVGQVCPATPPQSAITPLPDVAAILGTLPNTTSATDATESSDSQSQETPAATATNGEPTVDAGTPDGEAPDVRTPSVAATATAVAAAAAGTSLAPDDANLTDDNDNDGGFPTLWVVIGIVLSLGAAASGGYLIYRRRSAAG